METRIITYAELQQAEDEWERASRPATMPMTPTERAIERERIEIAQELREQNGDPKANARYEEMLQWRLSPLGRMLTEKPHLFRMYTYTGDGVGHFRAGDRDLYWEQVQQAAARTIPGGVQTLGSVK